MRASNVTVIVAFYATHSIAAPAPGFKDTAFDPAFSLRCLDSPNLKCPSPGRDSFGQPIVIGKRDELEVAAPVEKRAIPFILGIRVGASLGKVWNAITDKRDETAVVGKRDEVADVEKRAIPFILGARVGAAIGKFFLFNDKRGAALDMPAALRKRDDQADVEKRAIPFILGARVGAAIGKFFLFNDKRDAAVDMPALGKRDAEDQALQARQLGLGIRVGAALGRITLGGDDDDDEIDWKRDVPAAHVALGPLLRELGIEVDLTKEKRDALVDIDGLPLLGDILDKLPLGDLDDILGKLPIVGDLPVVGDFLKGDDADKKTAKRDVDRRSFVDSLRNFLNGIGADPTDDDPLNPFDDPGLPGKRSAQAFTA